jgi:DinB family protein
MSNEKQVMVKMALDLWSSRIKATDELFDSLTDEQLMKEIAPGRNRGIYLLGHLTAVNDHMLPLLGFEKAQYPQLDEPFLAKADKVVVEIPTVKELRASWKSSNEKLAAHFNKLQAEEWFQKHTTVSAEDFAKEPHRNKLNVVMGRTVHLSSHFGQLLYLKNK